MPGRAAVVLLESSLQFQNPRQLATLSPLYHIAVSDGVSR